MRGCDRQSAAAAYALCITAEQLLQQNGGIGKHRQLDIYFAAAYHDVAIETMQDECPQRRTDLSEQLKLRQLWTAAGYLLAPRGVIRSFILSSSSTWAPKYPEQVAAHRQHTYVSRTVDLGSVVNTS